MVTKLQKWGNSLAVRIPKPLAEELEAEAGVEVDLQVEDGRLTLTPVRRSGYSLDELVAGITPENRHDEVDWGPPRGREAW
jgi:antitoxin MazE